MDVPKLTGREFRTWDWYGWIMAILGSILMYVIAKDADISWWTKIVWLGTIVFVFLEYVIRVAYGRVYKYVFYDTIIRNMYQLKAEGNTYYVCAEDEEELKRYMRIHYEEIKYTIIDTYPVESFIKREHYQ